MPLDVCPGAQHLRDLRAEDDVREQAPSERLRAHQLTAATLHELVVECRGPYDDSPAGGDCMCHRRRRRIRAALDLLADVERERETAEEAELARFGARLRAIAGRYIHPSGHSHHLATGPDIAGIAARAEADAADAENETRGTDCLERDDVGPLVCPGCHAVDGEECAPDCIDRVLAEDDDEHGLADMHDEGDLRPLLGLAPARLR